MTAACASPAVPPVGLLVKRFPKLSETFILEEVLGLERLGVELQIYALAAPSDAHAHADAARVRASVTQVPARLREDPGGIVAAHLNLLCRHPARYAAAWAGALRRGRAGLRDFMRAGWLAQRMQRDGVEHLHTHFISAPADVAELASQVGGRPFSISAHAKDIYLSPATDLKRKLTAACFTVTCTEFNRRTLSAIAPEARVVRMYHGIDGRVFHPSHRLRPMAAPRLVPRLLSVGRLVEKKGLDTLVDACRLLHGRGVAFLCDIVGYGEERDRLAAQIDSHGLGGQIRLLGKLTREHVIERYAHATVYVQPSRVATDGDRDGIPNVLLEAMAIGLPVVTTRVSGIPELVRHRANGLLVEPDDAAALADAIEQLIDTPALAAGLARAARDTVTEHFDNDRNLRVVLQLLEAPHAHAASCAIA